ncbi:hypothetical protein IM697_26415 [Streptomyces ferrugineus]|uniref:Uncharacterized protein n=1 Tax=Streptomyces ferrugineus TaxID=1413221 RepID=A0A7M2SE75_9ACTN|nr:hypothetical protein [Streptomyces ferrugineus]QOV33723.1 hypothetical protein IM697_26415 [Streptomyces ferrugineus]
MNEPVDEVEHLVHTALQLARRAVDAGDAHAAIVVPRGFTEPLHGGDAEAVRVLDRVDYGLQAQLARAVTESYVTQVNADRLSVATAVAARAPPSMGMFFVLFTVGFGARGWDAVGAPLLGIAVFCVVVIAVTALLLRLRRTP